jgi:hypothetical protein
MEARRELTEHWLPNLTDRGLARLADLLDRGDPMLIRRNWATARAMGCLATHAGWNHEETEHLGDSAGPVWLSRVAGVPVCRSHVVREWDAAGSDPYRLWELRAELVALLRGEQQARREGSRSPREEETESALVTC